MTGPAHGEVVVEADRVTRLYGEIIGLSEMTLSLPAGIHGLLGPNGAGKTTFLRLITGQARPTLGKIRVFGQDPWNNHRLLRRIGYCPDLDAHFPGQTGLDFVRTLLRANGHPRAEAEALAVDALKRTGADTYMDRRIEGMSKGMRQRTKVALAIAASPDLVILDEPLNGTDPMGRRDLIRVVRELGEQGATVIVSSHVLHEVEAMTDEFVLLFHGRVLAHGNVHEIRELLNDIPHRIVFRAADHLELARHLLTALPLTGLQIDSEADTLTVRTLDPGGFYDALPAVLAKSPTPVREVRSEDDNLEAVFRYLITN